MEKELSNCAQCPYVSIQKRICMNKEGANPGFCPTINKADLNESSLNEYLEPEVFRFFKSSVDAGKRNIETNGVDKKLIRPLTRIEQTIELCKKMGYHRIGLAFCKAFRKEMKVIEKIFSGNGFEVVTVMCKVGRILPDEIGIHHKEAICNPIFQAKIMNDEKTEFNITIGLCVGHDSLFFKYSDAMSTVLITKDKVLGHNPLAAIHNIDGYYKFIMPDMKD